MLISGSIFIVSFLGLYLTLSFRALAIRKDSVYLSLDNTISEKVFSFIDSLAFYVVTGLKLVAHHSYLFLLVLSRNIVSLIKYFVVKVEKKFIKLIDSVRGKGVIHKKGSVSLFLREIKEYQDKTKKSQ